MNIIGQYFDLYKTSVAKHPKAIQVHLGHSSISVTMDRYGHLFPSDMEALAVALNGARGQALAVQMRTKPRSRGCQADQSIA